MNTTVSATNMQVKAVAEEGLLINEVNTSNSTSWDNEATTSQTEGILLRATSTANTTTWYTAKSSKSTSAAAATSGQKSPDLIGDYTTLSTTSATVAEAAAGTNALTEVYYVDDNGTNGYQAGEGYYAKYTYYLKSSSEAITCSTAKDAKNLNIKNVTVTGVTNTARIDAALRVAVVLGSKAYIYAPVADATTSYYVAAGANATTVLSGQQATALTSIPATTDNGTPVYIYLYFEGEDGNLKTENIVNALDNLTVSVSFELVTNAAAATDNGVSLS